MSEQAAMRLAQALASAWRTGTPIVTLEAPPPASAAEAYRVQERLLDALAPGVRPRAWKVSPRPAGPTRQASPVPPPLHPSGATIAAPGAGFLGVEAELAFRLDRTPASGGGTDALRDCVGEMVVLIEACATRYGAKLPVSPLAQLADFQSHLAFVVGSGVRTPPATFAAQAVEVSIDGARVAGGVGTHPSGELWDLLAWTVDHARLRGWPLAAGDVVTTGSWTGMVPLAAGQSVRVAFAGIGEASLRLA